jgi:hypothetical protein
VHAVVLDRFGAAGPQLWPEARRAHELAEKGEVIGKVILEPGVRRDFGSWT